MNLPPALFIIGPTASGKTGLAMELIKKFPFEIISVDSALVYKDMDIGTAKPTLDELEEAPHRLISFIDPVNAYSAADFRRDALREMAEITSAGKIPVLVGGTMLYYRALENGLAVLPEADPVIRKKLTNEAKKVGWNQMHQQLMKVDSASAKRLHPNDKQRIQRALEVFELTGKSLTEHQSEHQKNKEKALPYRLFKIALIPEEREWIRELADIRFRQMLEDGFMDEMQKLHSRKDLHADLPSIRCVGYRQAWQYLEGELSYDEMIERAVIATRQLAKRQMTWMRSEKNIIPYGAKTYNLSKVVDDINKFLDFE